jgi:hypothetical protein
MDQSHWLCDRGQESPAAHNNSAVYGPCIATLYNHLELTGLPEREAPGLAGLAMELQVVKKDAYGQDISADSSSSLQLRSALGGNKGLNDESVAFLGSIFSGFHQGRALFSVAVKPTFASVSALAGRATLHRTPFVFVTGTDSSTGALMQTEPQKMYLAAEGNHSVCPPGYVLALDADANGGGRPGGCTRCSFGKYSLSPLVGAAGSMDPGCLNCPAGGDCSAGGDVVVFDKGNWTVGNGTYLLTSCPTGHKMITSSHDDQLCEMCPQGEECIFDWCTTCTQCAPGHYKAVVGTEACLACPPNAYREASGATELGNCLLCQAKSTTDGGGQSSRRACVCDKEYYLITSNPDTSAESLSCQTCPKGAVCGGDGECALRNADADFNCTDGTSSIVGAWELDSSSGQYQLTSCPAGYEMKTQEEQGSADLQECFKCPSPSTYILNPDVDECQPCPPGLHCDGTSTVQPVVQNSTWEQDGAIYRLQSCPSGYAVFPVSVDASNAALQECTPCPEGTECVLETCKTCSHCAAGTYKDVVGTQACRSCPQNTYNPDVNSKTFANCLTCPQGADTGGLVGQTSLDACLCSDRMYSTELEPVFTCETCPSGAMCMGDGTCALRHPSKQCGTGARIKGSWIRSPVTGKFAVIG